MKLLVSIFQNYSLLLKQSEDMKGLKNLLFMSDRSALGLLTQRGKQKHDIRSYLKENIIAYISLLCDNFASGFDTKFHSCPKRVIINFKFIKEFLNDCLLN
jgi:hypothetical protein